MDDGGRAAAHWSSNTGTHTLTIKEAVTHLPQPKSVVVTAQIHGADGDVSMFRLEGRKLCITKGSESRYKLVTADYVPGTVFEAKYVVGNDQVKAYYNGALQATIDGHFTGAYFKAGAYTQANCSNASPCSSNNYGEVVIHSLDVTHE